MPGPGHFDAHADVYERARPPYPPALWERLRELGLLAPGVRVVELGAGTGQATGPLVDAGTVVTAVEPGPALAERLARRLPSVTAVVGTAEEVPLPAAAFDLAVVATAVHWLDLGVVLPAVHRALVPGGHLLVWRTAFGDPDVPVTAFRRTVAEITGRRPGPPRPGPGELDTEEWVRRLTAGDRFAVRHVEHFRWSVELDAGQVRDLFTTFSDWTSAEVDEAAAAVRALGGRVLEHYVTPLVVLRAV
ncbi:class I SAM-dependent methyltransferase [Cellulomonas telluris]|uniref:class I SAM-dependent methyltransferase n=1 Tax=Cellulomonas telluris TaxID=2306636 RepID=UPI0010A9445A|nr:class I SAM-dependent methyltransferase [Cellulomonas telluris]